MRLSENKIRYLSEKLVRLLEARDDVRLVQGPDPLAMELASVIREELREEDLLDEEVEKVIRQNRRQIDAGNVDLSVLRMKIKKQLARERGIVL